MTIKDETQLNSDFADGFRTVTAGSLQDFVDSKFAVGGAMSCRNVPFTFLTSNWEEFSGFTTSFDTKGVQEDLARGVFTVEDLSPDGSATGAYTNDLTMIITTASTLNIAIGIQAKGTLTNFRSPQMEFVAGVPRSVTILGGDNFPLAGQEMGVVINGTAGETINIDMAQFRVVRQ